MFSFRKAIFGELFASASNKEVGLDFFFILKNNMSGWSVINSWKLICILY